MLVFREILRTYLMDGPQITILSHLAAHIAAHTNIKRNINQRQFGSININLSRANKCSV